MRVIKLLLQNASPWLHHHTSVEFREKLLLLLLLLHERGIQSLSWEVSNPASMMLMNPAPTTPPPPMCTTSAAMIASLVVQINLAWINKLVVLTDLPPNCIGGSSGLCRYFCEMSKKTRIHVWIENSFCGLQGKFCEGRWVKMNVDFF